jgi:flagellar biosynthesis/type III secretory pathway chaperone
MAANEIRRHIDTILNQHNAVFRAIRDAGAAFDTAIVGLRTTLDAIQAANHAQGAAITAAIEANQAALRLLRDLPETM